MRDEFSIHLLSNVSPETFPGNKAQRFSTLLTNDIHLNGEWEVGLRNIMYPTEIASATEEDKIHFYTYTSLDRTSIVPFRRKKDSTIDDVPYQLTIRFPKMSKSFIKNNFPAYVYSALNAHPLYNKKFFSLDYNEDKKFILTVPEDDIVIEMTPFTSWYLGLLSTLYAKGKHWAWTASHPKREQFKNGTLEFFVYDLTYYEKDVFKMAFNGKAYVCHELGLEIHDNGQIIDKGKMEYKFLKFDKETHRIMDLANEYPNASVYKNKSSNSFHKLTSEEWKALKPEVTVWYNRLKAEEKKIEEVGEAITLNSKVDLEDTTQLLKTLNGRKDVNDYSVSYNESIHRFKLEIGNKYLVRFSPSLWSILGFEEKLSGQYLFNTTIEAEYFPTLDRGIRTLILYSNIVEASFIGNTQAPLLAICPFEKILNKDSHVIQKEILKPLYVPLNRNVLHQIDISIHDEAGALIPFIHGKTVLTLHFRKLRN